MTKRIYKIHPAYIDYQGKVVISGEYDETQIDVSEARLKSNCTLMNGHEFTKVLTLTPPQTTVFGAATVKEMFGTITQTVVEKIKVNTATLEQLTAIKFIGKATANKVIESRGEKRFNSYAELNSLVPLKGKMWEDIIVADFEIPRLIDNQDIEKYV
jgi:hypothetical protein